MNTYVKTLQTYRLSGRAAKAAYWPYVLITLAVYVLLGLLAVLSFNTPLAADVVGVLIVLFFLATTGSLVAATVRRLHDSDKSAAWLLVLLVPAIGLAALVLLLLLDSTAGPNRYGPQPR